MTDPIKTHSNPYNVISRKTNAVLHVVFAFYTILCIVPIWLVFAASISDETYVVLHGFSLFPSELSMEAYKYLLVDSSQIFRAYGISIFVTVLGTFLTVFLNAAYAYPLARNDFPYRNFFAFFIFFTMLFGGGLVPSYLVNTQLLGLKNNIWALIVPGLAVPFYVIMMRTFFANSLPPSILEAARIDGAGELRTFFTIVVPLSMPVLATVGMFSTLGFWNDWFSSLLYITDDRLVSLQYLMFKVMKNIEVLTINQQLGMDSSIASGSLPSQTVRMAMAIIGIGPIILAYPFFQKYFVKGLTVGSVKG